MHRRRAIKIDAAVINVSDVCCQVLHRDVSVGEHRRDARLWARRRRHSGLRRAIRRRVLLSRHGVCAHLHRRVPAETVRCPGQVPARLLRHERHRHSCYRAVLHRTRHYGQQGPQRSIRHAQSIQSISVS